MKENYLEESKMLAEKRAEELLVASVKQDFEERRRLRLPLERQWELNMSFLAGKQYCGLNYRGELIEEDRGFVWQNRAVFNHIAPLIESRLARFSKIAPVISVRPASDNDKDVSGAQIAERLISASAEKQNLAETVKKVTVWSETCGSGFYKVIWNANAGDTVALIDATVGGLKKVTAGEGEVIAISPFEIFPDNLAAEDLDQCFSVMQAKVLPVREIKARYGAVIKGEEVEIFGRTRIGGGGLTGKATMKDAALVIEKYERPSEAYPDGRLITVAGDTLLYCGDLPYLSDAGKERGFPFIKQDCVKNAGCFFGSSIIERLIPIQRAYNALKNRKHEFINRLTMGVMSVEDGSVDVDDLSEEGLEPGKVLVYRQGSTPPHLLDNITMPTDFNDEEDKLLNEFVVVSGVAEISSASTNAHVQSGSALEMLIAQDNERLILPAERIRNCFVEIAKKLLRLYAQFSIGGRTVRYRDNFGKSKTLFVGASAFNSEEVYLENENELMVSDATKKENVFKLFQSGLLTDEEGSIRPATKEKVLALLGYKDLDYQKGIARLHEEKASEENEKVRNGKPVLLEEVDDDGIHVEEHTRYILSEYADLKEEARLKLQAHLKEHRDRILQRNSALTKASENL